MHLDGALVHQVGLALTVVALSEDGLAGLEAPHREIRRRVDHAGSVARDVARGARVSSTHEPRAERTKEPPMITDIASYLRFFDSVRRRTARDVAALPPAAAAWRPPAAGGESGWGIGQIVGHIGASRLYFASAYRNEGWIWTPADVDIDDQRT